MTDTTYITDAQIEQAIASQDGPLDHPRTASVDEVREALEWVQRGVLEDWSGWCHGIENGEHEVIAETDAVIVFATGETCVPTRDLTQHYDGELGERVPDIVNALHHDVARGLSDYDWGYVYPLVVAKPDSFDAGQQYVEAVVNGLQARGLSPGQAWAYYGVEIRGNSMKRWGARKGDYDHKNVSDALTKAREKLPR